MADNSAIEWTDASWNCITGCIKVSAGCQNCYAIRNAYRLEHAFRQEAYAGTTRKLPDGSLNWTGRVNCLRDRLALPLKWQKGKRIFVNSMADMFHDDVPDEFIDQMFGIMALTPWHTYQVLTKRPERMLATSLRLQEKFKAEQPYLQAVSLPPDYFKSRTEVDWALGRFGTETDVDWPLPNVWLGVSTEDQRTADERIPLLLRTPAAVRWLSCEPLIGPIELSDVTGWGDEAIRYLGKRNLGPDGIAWVVAGGESGPGYRPLDLDWARSLRDQCKAANIPFMFKQVGGFRHSSGGRLLDGRTWDEYPVAREPALA
jgi:protein gp37